MKRPAVTPLGDDPDEAFTFSDATLVALMAVGALLLGAVFLLGAVCAEHRIAAALMLL